MCVCRERGSVDAIENCDEGNVGLCSTHVTAESGDESSSVLPQHRNIFMQQYQKKKKKKLTGSTIMFPSSLS